MALPHPPGNPILPTGLRLALMATVGVLHLGGFAAGMVKWAAEPIQPVAQLHEVEIVSLDALGQEPVAEKAVPSALPSLAGGAATAAQPQPPQAEPQPQAVSGRDAAIPDAPKTENPPPQATQSAQPAAGGNASSAKDRPAPSREVLVQYAALLSKAINRLKFYPAAARNERNSGVVEVTFRLDGAGRVQGAEVARSSGSAALDAAALQMIRAAEMPPPPNGPFRGRIAIDFRIKQ